MALLRMWELHLLEHSQKVGTPSFQSFTEMTELQKKEKAAYVPLKTSLKLLKKVGTPMQKKNHSLPKNPNSSPDLLRQPEKKTKMRELPAHPSRPIFSFLLISPYGKKHW
ncbi:hypothetical protein [Leptospira adleri]|uniref:hypothetical protein n=1 Tax=Leptospira adleri TaxID=2023186 RepID=UPI0014385F0D|nr:hypothetical protein [Leptospira adleri]